MSDFKFNGQKPDADLIASIVKLLDAHGIPNVMWGAYALIRYGAPLVIEDFTFVIPDQHIDRAREVLLAANFPPCPKGDDCPLIQPNIDLPHPYAHFDLDDYGPPRHWHCSRLELHKKSRLLWTLPDIPLGAPAPDDPNYMLVTDDRLEEYDPRMHIGRVPYTHYPVKIPTLVRYAESLAYLYLRDKSSEMSLFPGIFVERAQPICFTGDPENLIQVDIIPPHLPPYLPAHAVTLGSVNPNHLHFLAPLDLLVYKIHCCSMRPSSDKRRQDARDAQKLVNILSGQGGIALDNSQLQAVLSGLDGMLEYSGETREWWESALGLSG
ncbi:uncharacterized protein CDV56_108170 [Aspergillus thermomutatus]|uniref:Uncharacterized protein n=1 Tax=Aspergillus thermomutatus TaxID=41047 RepID=A0A397HMZ1_ASPTH|nr:uncharacterized protein CDV56_108170 [Aspergillus thermomutatus]RHZ61820.1 hypothetical protein CDV56_108170 [Aspergillus thermomutatus]